jgi:hypothetical protein
MAVYMVDRDLKGITLYQLASAQQPALVTYDSFFVQPVNSLS